MKHLLTSSAIALAVAAPASAATLDLTFVSGTWTSASTPVDGLGSNAVTWGNPTTSGGPKSGYTFDAATVPDGPFAVGEVFELGNFVHNNFPITDDGSVPGDLRLEVAWTVRVPGDGFGTGGPTSTEESGLAVFDFVHLETPNSPGGGSNCANGEPNGSGVNSAGCADRVTFVNNTGLSTGFTFEGLEYFLNISGFEVGGVTATEFWTAENAPNTAALKASFTVIPLPATGWLLLSVIGVGAVAHHRRRKSV